MSTRSCVGSSAEPKEGRYVHSDGYPSWTGSKLVELIRRDGVETVLETLTETHYGWSAIDLDVEELHSFQQDGRFELVPGYGIAYTEVQNQASPDDWVDENNSWGTVFQYFISEDGTIEVFRHWEPEFRVNAFDEDAIDIMEAYDY